MAYEPYDGATPDTQLRDDLTESLRRGFSGRNAVSHMLFMVLDGERTDAESRDGVSELVPIEEARPKDGRKGWRDVSASESVRASISSFSPDIIAEV